MNELQAPDWVVMSRRERDGLAVMRSVVNGERTQVQAARMLKKSVRQIRRLQRKWGSRKRGSPKASGTYKPAADHPWRTGQSR
jgi:hypothetical protein